MFASLLAKEKKMAVIGLGYVGLPVALEMAKHINVIGFDINEHRIDALRQGIDPGGEISKQSFEGRNIVFTSAKEVLREAAFYIIAVPTPVDDHNVPDLTPILGAAELVGSVIKKGDYVVIESTVYPGCTEEDCIPVIERVSGLAYGTDFKAGYSPERINPGDKVHTIESVVKVVAGCDAEALEEIAAVYGLIVKAGIHKVTSIKVAEAAKVIENTQRDLNIALMNELSIIFDRMGINTFEVLEAAGTKWNFLKFFPGLVGGHCIGVDPYYLTYKASELGYSSKVILAGRYINDHMGAHIVQKILQHVLLHNGNVREAKVLILGATFKENVSDIRNSKVADVVKGLQSYYLTVEVTDPNAESAEVEKEYGFKLTAQPAGPYDVVVVAVAHEEYSNFSDSWFANITREHALIADIKGIYRNKIHSRMYWSL
ncbi:UDP-N-acetyl-D-galactosamine dehydrogenase [Filimonas zeae]|uniref:UDP-N-acetyl-D-galactosamine dehydrogenase n=1 Tax=Filimonas zeae TaxID=1737353 RepID=A0A917IN96_9BACT|nr:nucleotide sugar dehydrogenase [Filimonas zeae]MDR6337361.1 UDP-N-acetyl-D-galactosamine dehydrogenase [Filimonas zeae]GGH58241.1 UDP-N-acetyl-D-galactosamine dehydrogenase [Filimonas zeae]